MENYILINHLQVEVEKQKLSKLINKEINEKFNEKDPLEIDISDNKVVNLFVNGEVEFDFREDTIYIVVPMSINAAFELPVGTVSVDAQIRIHTHSKLDIQSDFNIDTTSSISEVEWVSDLDIHPKIVDMIIPDGLIKSKIDDQLPKMGEKIDEAIKKVLNIPQLLMKVAWERVVNIPLGDQHSLYIKLKPDFMEMEPIEVKEDRLLLGSNTKWFFENSTEHAELEEKYVPKVQYLPASVEHEKTRIYVHLDLADLGEPAYEIIQANPAIEDAIHSQVEKVIIRMLGEDGIAIAMRLKGILNGGLSVVGIPRLNKKTLMLDMENLRFDFSGKNMLSSLTGNIGLSVAKTFIRKKFPIDLKPIIDKIILETNANISEIELNDDMAVKGRINDYTVEDFKIEKGVMSITLATDLAIQLV